MINIPKKTLQRFALVKNYVHILKRAKERDVNESDTIKIIIDMLSDILGYDKFLEITGEYEVKGKYCDIAIKVDNNLHFLIECKAIGIDLKENHLNQALFYSERLGIDWAILTNGIQWNIYKINFGKPISISYLFDIDFLEEKHNDPQFHEKLYLLSKEAISKSAIDLYHEEKCIINKYNISAILQKKSVLNIVRRELKAFSKKIKVDRQQILDIIRNDILKRELLESDEALDAAKKVKKISKQKAKRKLKSENRI